MTEQTPAARDLTADPTGADYSRPHITRGPGRGEETYPRQDAYTWQEFAGIAIELGGYSDITAIDPYSGDRLWVPRAFAGNGDTAEWFAALRLLVDAMEANADSFGGETRTEITDRLDQARHQQFAQLIDRQRMLANGLTPSAAPVEVSVTVAELVDLVEGGILPEIQDGDGQWGQVDDARAWTGAYSVDVVDEERPRDFQDATARVTIRG